MEQKLKPEKKKISIKQIELEIATYQIVGMTPLLMDKMPPDVLIKIQEGQEGISKGQKENRNINNEINNALHILPDGNIGFPSVGFKSGIIASASIINPSGSPKSGVSKKATQGIQILNDVDGLIPIKFKKQDVLIHNIKSNTKHSPQFYDWSCELKIQFNTNSLSAKDLAVLINYAGFYRGIGIWSPRCQCGGKYGMYKLKEN